MSTVQYYRDLLAQKARIESFRKAMRAVVRPGDSVLDVGTGLGTFAFFAVEAGAGTVWALDGDPIVHVAKAVAQLNGLEQRVEFVRGWVPDVDLPGKADVIVFEDFSPRLLDGRMFKTLRETQNKYATATTCYLPARATVHLAAVTGASKVLDVLGPEEQQYGIDWQLTRDYVANSVHHGLATDRMLVSRPREISAIDFSRCPRIDAVGGHATWIMEEAAIVDGLAYWFDLELAPGIVMSNAPGAKPASWSHCVLLLDPPLELAAGASLEASIAADNRKGVPGWLRWEARAGGECRTGHEFRSFPAGTADLVATSPDAVPALNRLGRLTKLVAQAADGSRSLGEIADLVVAHADDIDRPDAERLVADLLRGKIVDGRTRVADHA